MRVYGVDFTSSPGTGKPITVAECRLAEGRMVLDGLRKIRSLAGFEQGLAEPGPWIAGMDFPFGLPRRLVEARSWPTEWTGYLGRVAAMSRQEFEDLLLLYKEARPPGDKEHRRSTDQAAGALSPMKLYGVPLAKMFYEGATRLLRSPLSVPPCRPRPGSRAAVEVYPALVARTLIGRRSYKESRRHHDARDRRDARRQIVGALGGEVLAGRYGLRVEVGQFQADELVAEPSGDLLDAVLAAVQAAWAWERRRSGFGIPDGCDACEGWIVDPATAAAIAG